MNNLVMGQRICACAKKLWQDDGALEGCEDEYWRLARTMIEREMEGKVLKQSVAQGNRDELVAELETV